MKKSKIVYPFNNRTRKVRGKGTLKSIVAMIKRGDMVTVHKPLKKKDLANKIVEVAMSQVGKKEYPAGSNRGADVEKYQASTSVGGTGWPWCQAFCCWVLKQASAQKFAYKGAYVPHAKAYAKLAGLWTDEPKRGYLACLNFGSGIERHIGIVQQVLADGLILVEGNTSEGASQDNGGAVLVKKRDKKNVTGYIKTY